MSKIEVDKIDPQSGTDLELGTSGDTITIPAGVTFDSSAATNTLPATVVTTTGTQTLTNKSIATTQLTGTITPSDSTVSLAKLTATGTKDATTFLRGDNTFNAPPNTGLTEVDQWRLTANLTDPGDADITANLERVDDAAFSKIGTGMSLSSGIYTFPSTGVYRIQFIGHFYIPSGNDGAAIVLTMASSDSGSNYDTMAEGIAGSTAGGQLYNTHPSECFVNVTNASTFRVKFRTSSMAATVLVGSTDSNTTSFSFIRLGDSQ